MYFVVRARCRRKESSRSLSHLLMIFLYFLKPLPRKLTFGMQVYSQYLGQVRLLRSSGQDQGHRRKKRVLITCAITCFAVGVCAYVP